MKSNLSNLFNKSQPTALKSRTGWRYFKCEVCDYAWREASRDAMSPSSEPCPRCDDDIRPYYGELDDRIATDKFGNITECLSERIYPLISGY